MITSRVTCDTGLSCAWTIIRPITVWGPHHPLLAAGVWSLLHSRRSTLPAVDPVMGSYGYVKTGVWQNIELLG